MAYEHTAYTKVNNAASCRHVRVTYPPPSGDFYSLSLRLLSAGIAFNVLEGRSFTPCPPFPLHLIPISSIHFASKLF